VTRKVYSPPGTEELANSSLTGGMLQDVFTAKESGLAAVMFSPPPDLAWLMHLPVVEPILASAWAGACARYHGVESWKLEYATALQAEQSLIGEKAILSPAWSITIEQDQHADPGRDAYLSWDTLVRVVGNKRMYASCGVGIPDAGRAARFKIGGMPVGVEQFIGFPRQAYHLFRLLALRINRWNDGTANRTVKLYSGEVVECGDFYAYWRLNFTPTEAVLMDRYAILKGLREAMDKGRATRMATKKSA
jgi:hypothetical protein